MFCNLQCPLLEDLTSDCLDVVTMTPMCPSLRKLRLSSIPNLEICKLGGPLSSLDVTRCPLLNVSTMIQPTLHSLALCECIVSFILAIFVSAMFWFVSSPVMFSHVYIVFDQFNKKISALVKYFSDASRISPIIGRVKTHIEKRG